MHNKDVMKKEPLYRTQVLLEPEQVRELTTLAESEGISLSALLRRIVARGLEEQRQRKLADAANALMELYYTEEAMTAFDAQDGIGMNGDGA